MTPLIANLNSRSIRPSVLSPRLRMPHVFVIPPEEEQQDNPPWCCFDADEQPESNNDFPSNPDIHYLDVPYPLRQSEHDVPALKARTSVYQPRPRLPASKKLEKKQRPEAVKIVENKKSQARQMDVQEDSDIVEVVKVRRVREALTDLEDGVNLRRSKTLRARATKALRSIKNVGKGSHRTHVKELWTSSESMPGTFKGVQEQIRSRQSQTDHHPPASPAKKRSISRGNSRSLSQIFRPTRSSSPESSLAARVASSVALPEVPLVFSVASPSALPHLKYNDSNLSINEPHTIDDALERPISRSPSTKKGTRFSVRELHRLFSFSPSSPDDPSSAPTAATAPSSACSNSMPSTSTSTLSSCYPGAHTEEGLFADAHFLDLESADRKLASRYHQGFHANHDDDFSTPRCLSDLSLEMRLDSLHFDTLSFDPEDFDVSMEGNVLR